MRLPKFLFLAMVVTVLALVYVWQQTHIVHLAYEGQRRMAHFQDLLDENSVLRYNLTRKTSLIVIGDKISQGKDFNMPKNYCLVKIDASSGTRLTRQETLLARMFGVKRQAEAKAVNPSTINFR